MFNRRLVLVSLLYFAEGFPFGILEQMLPVYFRVHGMSLVDIGILSLIVLPYALKFLWAPAVDFIGTRRRWITSAQFMMAALIVVILSMNPSEPSSLLWAAMAGLAIFSATQDIAIDAYTIELLSASEMGMANGVRQAAYRGAMIVSGGLFVALGGVIGWQITFVIASGILVLCGIICLRLPAVEVERPKFSLSSLVAPVSDFWQRSGLIYAALFILMFKLGDMAIGPMIRPFWLARGHSVTEIGLITGTFGIVASITGGLAGGIFMARFGIYKGIWFTGFWQAISNLGYVWVASSPSLGSYGIYMASVVESFCNGLGSSAFLAFLMSICRKEFSATQYALLSALFRISGTIAGAFSGLITQDIGYAQYFALTFLLGLPAFLFIPKILNWIPDEGSRHQVSPH